MEKKYIMFISNFYYTDTTDNSTSGIIITDENGNKIDEQKGTVGAGAS